ncbi:MAG TPA: ribosome small subunit-dependent GTPase A [Bacteroidia bacterium]|nr:ribosome small subunit-dependent GTPase A [Bacteroidia bacterium]
MQEGIVLKSLGAVYNVLTKSGETVSCTLKGNLRLKSISTTNPAVVGDTVTIDETAPNEYVITEVAPRKNYIIRRSKKLSKQFQIIASNIDRVFVLVTITHPKTQNSFIDRILITAEAYQIDAHLIFNKTDLYNEKNKADAEERIETYTTIGYPCHSVSLLDDKQVASLKKLFTNKVSLLCGMSGTGKSTLINHLVPGINRKTGIISKAHKKGTHMTTFSEMIPLEGAGFVVDTPGIQEFGLADISKYELSQYFREMNLYRNNCKFNSCMHTNEPGCAVMEAVNEGKIAVSRYESYLSMLFNEGEEEVRYE